MEPGDFVKFKHPPSSTDLEPKERAGTVREVGKDGWVEVSVNGTSFNVKTEWITFVKARS